MTELSRREILAAVGAVGGIGVVAGMGTGAFLGDVERTTDHVFRAGSLDLDVDCASGNCAVTDDGTVALSLTDLQPGAAGEERITLTQLGNPGWLWLGATCPGTGLEEALEVTITFDRGCDESADETFSGSLREVLLEIRNGIRLNETCLDPDERSCVTFEWAFPNREGIERYEGESIEFELVFYVLQCRHNDGTVNPVPEKSCEGGGGNGISYVEVWGCTEPAPACECTKIGKLELSDAYVERCVDLSTDGIGENRIVPGAYDLPVDDDCADTGYDLVVTSTRENADGETTAVAFALVDGDGSPGPDLCRVELESGPDTVVYEVADLGDRSNDTGGELTATGG